MKTKPLKFIGCFYLLSLVAVGQTAWGNSVGKVTVMDIDEVRDAAQVARVKAQERANSDNEFDSDMGATNVGCGNLEIGNVQTAGGIGRPVPREVVIVIEGPVINADNRCR